MNNPQEIPMKAHERRETASYPYFKIAKWDDRAFAWKAGKTTFESELDAVTSVAKSKGRYRITQVEEASKTELEEFAV